MIKTICDKCGKPIDEHEIYTTIRTWNNSKKDVHLCLNCSEDFTRWLSKA